MLPHSSILPVAKDFESGLTDGLAPLGQHEITYTVIKEFIAEGGLPKVESAMNKLVSFDDVDIITGIVSNRVIEGLKDKTAVAQKPFLFSNVGGFMPNLNNMNEYMMLNSFHLWQHAWALGNWGVNNIGKRGLYVSAVYDAGYSFSHMFYEGMKAAGAEKEWAFAVAPLAGATGFSDMDILINIIQQHKPDFIFATFCGEETTLFLDAFIKAGLHKTVKLMGLPFLLAPFKPVADDLSIITTVIRSNKGTVIETVKSFYHLGYTAGTAIADAAIAANGNEWLAEFSKNPQLVSLQNLASENSRIYEQNPVDIMQVQLLAGNENIQQTKIGTNTTLSLKDEVLKSMLADIVASWQNPYLCI